jgi:putative oxidoreductase
MFLAHAGDDWTFTHANGGWEYPAFLAVAAIVQSLIGDGVYALRSRARAVRSHAVAAA